MIYKMFKVIHGVKSEDLEKAMNDMFDAKYNISSVSINGETYDIVGTNTEPPDALGEIIKPDASTPKLV